MTVTSVTLTVTVTSVTLLTSHWYHFSDAICTSQWLRLGDTCAPCDIVTLVTHTRACCDGSDFGDTQTPGILWQRWLWRHSSDTVTHVTQWHMWHTTHVGQWRGKIVARSGVKLDKVQKIKTQSDNHECTWPWPHTLELNNSNVGFIFGIWDTHLFLNPSYLFLNVVACMQDWKSMNMPSCFIKMPQRWPRKLNTD